jgi:hypothetical protein
MVKTRGDSMSQSQKIFEAIMKTKGYADLSQKNGRYINTNIQTRWNYFIMGWEMAKVSA